MLPLCAAAAEENSTSSIPTALDDLRGQKIGVLTGGVTAQYVTEYYDGESEPVHYNALPDMIAAAKSGKVAGYVHDYIAAEISLRNVGGLSIIDEPLKSLDVGYCFRKDEAGAALCAELDEFLNRCREDGTLDDLLAKWRGDDESVKIMDTELTGENGMVTMACSGVIGMPYCYLRDGEFVGYDLELIYRFCREKGYALSLIDTDAGNGLVTAVASGKADFGGTNLPITEERKETVLFSTPYNSLDFMIVVPAEAAESDSVGIAEKIAGSFRRTFLAESRWKLFAAGLGRTLVITVLSAAFGTVIGFAAFHAHL